MSKVAKSIVIFLHEITILTCQSSSFVIVLHTTLVNSGSMSEKRNIYSLGPSPTFLLACIVVTGQFTYLSFSFTRELLWFNLTDLTHIQSCIFIISLLTFSYLSQISLYTFSTKMSIGQLFSRNTQALFYNYKQLPIQRMLAFNFLCGVHNLLFLLNFYLS